VLTSSSSAALTLRSIASVKPCIFIYIGCGSGCEVYPMGETMIGVTGVIAPGLTAIIGFVVIDFLTFWDARNATQQNNGPRQISFNRPPAFFCIPVWSMPCLWSKAIFSHYSGYCH
jgi:hypothetical protein